MAGEIATAFVRIRPNMSGFKSETEHGVRSTFEGIAKIVGVALGVGEAFSFGKEIISDAAQVQKSMEVVNAEFGRGAEQIHKFAENAGIGLGITSHLTESTAARFGILFQNMGIGQQASAGMTVGLLKLAGSLAAIRGVDPATVMERLPLAIAGNLRSLKQLGVSIDASQIKYAALKLGLISSVKDGITPAIRAQAIYALATANLGKFQELAKKHAGDLVNVQRRLSAEWDHAKELLGKALLPIITKYATSLEHWFARMSKSGALQRDFNKIAQTTVSVVRVVASALSNGWQIWQTVTGWIGGTKQALILFFGVLAANKLRSIAGSIVSNLVDNGFKKVGAASVEAKIQAKASMGTMGLAAKGLGRTIRTAIVETGYGAIIIGTTLVTTWVIQHWEYVRAYFKQLGKNIGTIWAGVAQEIIGEFQIAGGAIATALATPIVGAAKLAQKAFNWLPHFANSLAGVPNIGPIAQLAATLAGIPAVSKDANKAIDALVGGAYKMGPGLIEKGVANVKKGGAAIVVAEFKAAAEALAGLGKDSTILAKLKVAGTDLGTAIADGAVTVIAKVPARATKAMLDALNLAREAANRAVVAATVSAETNLQSIGAKLANTVNKILDKLGLLDGSVAGSAQAVAFKKLRALIASGAPDFKIERASRELSTDLAGVGKTALQIHKDAVRAQLTQYVTEFNRGQLTLTTFNKRVAELLAKNHITYKNIGKILGKAFADGFEENLKALREQAQAIAATPARFRRQANRATADGGIFRIVRPIEVLRRENQQIARIAERQRERIAKATEKTAVATAKTQAGLAAAHVGGVPGLPGHKAANARTTARTGVRG